MGTAYFADLVKQFGGAHFALASYNAGREPCGALDRRAPGRPRDEFIDDIPFPETQAYVKKILGTAEDYRRLYGSDSPRGGEDERSRRHAGRVAPGHAAGREESGRPKTSRETEGDAREKSGASQDRVATSKKAA